MSDLDHTDVKGVFTYFPIVVPLGTGARRFVVSTYNLSPAGGECFWLDSKAAQGALLRRLEMSFERTGGVPPTLAMRSLRPLGRANGWENPVWTPQFLRFCSHYGCQPVLEARDPVWEGAVRDSILYHTYRDLGELEFLIGTWTPNERSTSALRALPDKPFITQDEVFRRAAADGFLYHRGDYYSVPQVQAGKNLWIRRRTALVSISTANGDLVATHPAGSGRGDVIMDPKHFTPHHRSNRETHAVEIAFLRRFPRQQNFLSLLLAQHRTGAAEQLRALLRIADEHSEAAWQAVFEKAVRYNNFSHRFIRGILCDNRRVRPHQPVQVVAVQGELFF